MAIRVNLYFPNEHWVAEIPVAQRAVELKRLIDLSKYNESLINLEKDIAHIKNILQSGNLPKQEPPDVSKETENADRELILSILNM